MTLPGAWAAALSEFEDAVEPPIEHFDDSPEGEALRVQTEFRERYLKPGASPGASR